MSELNALERAVLNKLLEGDHPALRELRRQSEVATVVSRRWTGVGFLTSFGLAEDTPRASLQGSKIRFGDVGARITGLQHGAGFLLYVDDGKLRMLEGYSYDEKWPERFESFELHYLDPKRQSVEEVFGPCERLRPK